MAALFYTLRAGAYKIGIKSDYSGKRKWFPRPGEQGVDERCANAGSDDPFESIKGHELTNDRRKLRGLLSFAYAISELVGEVGRIARAVSQSRQIDAKSREPGRGKIVGHVGSERSLSVAWSPSEIREYCTRRRSNGIHFKRFMKGTDTALPRNRHIDYAPHGDVPHLTFSAAKSQCRLCMNNSSRFGFNNGEGIQNAGA